MPGRIVKIEKPICIPQKNEDKLNIFLTLGKTYNQSMWCGANDIASENVFRWEDDGTIITQTWRSAMFEPGQPSNTNGRQNCVGYTKYSLLDDDFCDLLAMYVCEMA
ncbi:macrophage mannose receptor 1-like [Physella acuta]|uniref:macrophage mannose receptor 1-like n=1 Tax=Physella acuta TaxID=109671 RepID=UPI0027DD9872|nr:macrophage mannose receptor 1-like [Physella acuta]